ncbi:MAG: 3-deoxy-manno-octulosonate cytidylyltransferase, partial [Bartonella sp.]|nr:3-deoxy-manno-octulosonate cytidylyltransferase [Bartonella sp.]
YVYRRKALKKFITLKSSTLEQREKLEQLRALENNMRIDVEIIDTTFLSVDTQNDLERVRKILV